MTHDVQRFIWCFGLEGIADRMPYVVEDGKHEGPACMLLSVQVQKNSP